MTAARKGFSKVYNALLDPEIYADQNAKNLYLHLCLHAVYDKPLTVKGIIVNLGQYLISFYQLEKEILHKESNQNLKGKPRATWKRAAEKLQEKGLIRFENAGKSVLFTVLDLGADTENEEASDLQPQGIEPDLLDVADTEKASADTSADTTADTTADTLLNMQQMQTQQGFAVNRISDADTLADTFADTNADTPILNNNVFKNVFKKKDLDDDGILGLANKIANFGTTERNKFMNGLIERKFGKLPNANFFNELEYYEQQLGYELTVWAALQINGKITNPQAFYLDLCNKMRQNGITNVEEAVQYAAREKEKNTGRYKKTGTDGRQQQTGRQLSPRDTSGNFDNLPF